MHVDCKGNLFAMLFAFLKVLAARRGLCAERVGKRIS